MIIKIKKQFYEKGKINLRLFLKLFPEKSEDDFYKFHGIAKPKVEKPKIEENELSTPRNKRTKKSDKKISKDDN